MKSNKKRSLDAIMEKLNDIEKAQKERSFLSRLDMMISVILTLTFFMLSFLSNNIRPTDLPSRWIFSFLIALLSLLIFIVQGEIRAIILDDIGKRFDYWITLIWGLFQMCILFVLTLPYTFGFGIQIIFPTFLALPAIILLILLTWWIDGIFEWYNRHLLVRKLENYRSSFKTAAKGFAFLMVVWLLTFYMTSNL